MIGSKGNMFSEFDEGHPGVVLVNLVKIGVKPCLWGYFKKIFLIGVMTLCLSKPPHLLQTIIVETHIGQ